MGDRATSKTGVAAPWPTLALTLRACDWAGERQVEYRSSTYAVTASKGDGQWVELTCEQGDGGAMSDEVYTIEGFGETLRRVCIQHAKAQTRAGKAVVERAARKSAKTLREGPATPRDHGDYAKGFTSRKTADADDLVEYTVGNAGRRRRRSCTFSRTGTSSSSSDARLTRARGPSRTSPRRSRRAPRS